MLTEDLTRLVALRDAGVISEVEFNQLVSPPPAAPRTGRPVTGPGGPTSSSMRRADQPPRGSSSRMGDIAGTAAGALAGVIAGNALDRLLFDGSGSQAPAAGGAGPVEPVDWAYEGHVEYVDADGDGDVDASWTEETLIVNDGTPTIYTHTEYTEYLDTDGDGTTDAAVTYETLAEDPASDWGTDAGSEDWTFEV